MSVSIFEKLLGSYSGMRKRTWSPIVIESTEAGQVKSWKAKFSSKATDNATKKGEYEAAKTNITKVLNSPPSGDKDEVIRQQLASQSYGMAVLGKSTIYVSTYQGIQAFGPAKSGAVITALDELIRGLGEEEAEKSTTEKAGDKAVQDSEEKTEEDAPKFDPVKFSEEEKTAAETSFEKLMGMPKDAVQMMLLKLEKCINTPSKSTKLGQLFDSIGSDNPTLEQKSKEQLAQLTGHLFSITALIDTDEKTGRKFLRGPLSPAQTAALKVMTVRNKGDIYFGRPERSVPGYEDLQQQASQGDANYGFHLGKSLNQLGPFLKGVRLITDEDTPETMSDEEFAKLPQAFQSSKAGGSGTNDATGKLTEYFWELGFAIQSGDKNAVGIARQKVKKGLKALAALPEDLNSLECPLTNQNMDILEDILEEVELAGGIPQFAKNLVREVGLSVESFQTALNIQPQDVVLVDSPAQESKMGERPDVIAFISPAANINVAALQVGSSPVKLHVVQPKGTFDEDGKRLTGSDVDDRLIAKHGDSIIGTTMLNTSIKHKKRKGGTTRCGSFAFQNMVEPSTPEAPSDYDVLHTAETDRMVAAGLMTVKQQQACRKALKADRRHHAAVTRRLRAMTKNNRADVISFLRSTSLTGSFTVEGRQKYEDEANSIADGLKSKDPEVQRVAEIRVQQLARMRRQAGLSSGSELARASALNDAIGSFAAEVEEPIYMDSPQELRVTTNRQVMDEVARACWDEDGEVQVTPARTTIRSGDGSSMFGLRRVARKGKNPGYEFEMFPAGEAVSTKPVAKATPKKKPAKKKPAKKKATKKKK